MADSDHPKTSKSTAPQNSKLLETQTSTHQNHHTREELLKENEKLNFIIAQLRTENQRLHKMLDEEREMHHQVIHERNTYIAQLTSELDQLKNAYKQDHQWMMTQEAELQQKEKEIEKKQESLAEKENQLAAKEEGLKNQMRKKLMASSDLDFDESRSQISEFTDPKFDQNFQDLHQGFDGPLTPQSIRQDQSLGNDILLQQTNTAEVIQFEQKSEQQITFNTKGNNSQRRGDSDFVEDDSECSSQKPSSKRKALYNNQEQQQQPDDSNVVSIESLQSDRKNNESTKQGREEFELID